MNEHDKTIAGELQKNHAAVNDSVNTNLSNPTAVVIKLPLHFLKKAINEPENESWLYDELHYGNYE